MTASATARDRINRIAELLAPLVPLDNYLATIDSELSDDRHRFRCYWADPQTDEKKIFISIEKLPNPLHKVAALRGSDPDIDPLIHEIARIAPGEYASIKTSTDSIFVIKDRCAIYLGLPKGYDPTHYIELAYSILHITGCDDCETA